MIHTDTVFLPDEVIRSISSFGLSFFDLRRLACVSRDWQRAISRNDTGASFMKRAHLVAASPNSWMKAYQIYLNTPLILAVDCSRSMHTKLAGLSLRKTARAMTEQFASRHRDLIAYRGVECIAFAGNCVSNRAFCCEEVADFFKGRLVMDQLVPGTTLDPLFQLIGQMEQRHRKNPELLPTQVTIISDFECYVRPLPFSIDANLRISCIRLGEHVDGEKGERSILKDFARWTKQAKTILENRQAGVKRKRGEIVPSNPLLDLTFSSFPITENSEFEPVLKKRRRDFDSDSDSEITEEYNSPIR